MTTSTAFDPQGPDLSQCEAEPIHIPGAIQPHGVLLALHGPQLQITEVSASCTRLGVDATDLIGVGLGDALGDPLADAVRRALAGPIDHFGLSAPFRWSTRPGAASFVGYVHRVSEVVILELEPAAPTRLRLSEHLAQAMRSFSGLRAEKDLRAKLAAATTLFRRLTEYDRVMVYRFDEDWHGEVIAEDRRPDLESYLGLHYPASDIPSQARQVFLINPARIIVDVDYQPSPLMPQRCPTTGAPLDLSRSLLRSVSPLHLEYLRNMGVRSTMTISLLKDGRLWGLIACHHCTPHLVPGEIREIACWMAQDLATQIALVEEMDAQRYALHLKECRDRILIAMRQGMRLPGLLSGPDLADVLGAIGADGVALIRGDEVITGGDAPEAEQVLAIAAGLSASHPNSPSQLFATDCLSEHLAETSDLAATAAGVALFPLDAGQSIKLIWFRGEQLREVTWGGNPDKTMDVDEDGRLSPRRSFAAWSQIVRQRSRRWRPEELESARKLGALIDIEWRKMAEEALRENEALLTDVLDSLTAHIAVLNGAGTITLVNAAWRRFAEDNGGGTACLPGIDYVGVCRRALSGSAGSEASQALSGLQAVLASERGAFSLQYVCESPGGARWFEMRVLPLSGCRAGAVVAHEEITAQKVAEEALKLSEEQLRQAAEEALQLSQESFRLAVDNMPDAFVIYDQARRYSFLNLVALERAGVPLETYLGRRDDEIFGPEVYGQYLPHLQETYEQRAPVRFECQFELPTGRYDFVVTYVPMLRDGEVYQVFGFYYDITERKLSEMKLGQQAQKLREADWRKDEFLAMLAHELRNPLAPIASSAQILRRASLDAPLVWCLDVIDRQMAQLTRLVDDLLDISRITRGLIELQMEPLSVTDIIHRAVETSRPLIEGRNHELRVRLSMKTMQVHGDLVRLTQVVSNVVANAAKYTDEGGLIDLTADLEGQEVCIRVRDTGRGIEPEQLSQLFDLFYQVDRSIARSEGGLGIGLSLVNRLVDMHGGRVEVRSDGLGRGSEFSIYIPAMEAQAGPATAAPVVPPAVVELSTIPAEDVRTRVLIVDDNRDAIDSLQLLLGSEGYEVLVAYDGENALRLALSAQPEVVLLDIGLPGMDGYAVARALREQRNQPDLRIIAVTGYGQPDSRAKSSAAGFDLHLVKPVDFMALLKVLSEYRERQD